MTHSSEQLHPGPPFDKAMGVGRWTWDIAGGKISLSPELIAIYGLDGGGRVSPSLDLFADCLVPEDRTRVIAAISRTLSTGRPGHTLYFRIRRPDGAIRHIMSRARLERNAAGRPETLRGVDVDLSDETFAVDALTRTEAPDAARLPRSAPEKDCPRDPYTVAMHERDDLLHLIDTMPVMVTLYDPAVDMVLLNRAFETVTGWSRREVARRTMEVCYPDPAYRAEIAAFMETCTGWKDITMRTADGRDIATCWTNVRLSDQRRMGVGLDLSAEKTLERTLHVTETRLRLAQEIAKIGTFEWDIQRDINRWSPEMYRLYGVAEAGEALNYAQWATYVHPEDRAEAEAAVQRSLQTGRLHADWRIVRDDGDILWNETRATVEFSPDGTPLRMVGVNLDVTDRKRMEHALREEARAARARADELETLGAAAPIGIALFDPEFRFLWCNDWLAALNGVPAAEVRGRTVQEVVGEPTASELMGFRPRLLSGESVPEREIAVQDPATGDQRVFILSYTPLRDEGGTVTRFLGIVREVTERKQAEAYRDLALNELSHRVKNIFAVVRALAARTFAGNTPDAALVFEGRLNALSAAHDQLLATDFASADIEQLARVTLAAFAEGERLRLDGPPTTVSGRGVQMLALALHELATNAVKYGALSCAEGVVDLSWKVEEAGGQAECTLFWREIGGPPVAPPAERGFGLLMIERLLARDLGGRVALRFPPTGVECDIRWTL